MPELMAAMRSFGQMDRPGGGGDNFNLVMDAISAQKQRKSWDAAAKAIYSALEPGETLDGSKPVNPLGPKDMFDGLSREDRINKVKGFVEASVLKSAQKQQQQEELLNAFKTKMLQRAEAADTALEQTVADATAARPEFGQMQRGAPALAGVNPLLSATMQAIGNAGASRRQPLTAKAFLGAVGNHKGAINSPNFDNVLRAIEYGERAKGNVEIDPTPQPFDVGGLKGIYSRKTGAIHTAPNAAGNTLQDRMQLMERKALLDEKRSLITAHSRAFKPEDKAYYQAQIDELDAQLKPGAPVSKPASSETVITDKQNRKWRYKGSAADPKTDRDPKNWEKVQ